MTLPADLVPVSAQTASLGRAFADAGFALHLVGGPVRDALLRRTTPEADLDLTTDARPEADHKGFCRGGVAVQRGWTTGIEFGMIGARLHGGEAFEITTYRADRYDTGSPEIPRWSSATTWWTISSAVTSR